MLKWTPESTNAEQNARDIISAAMWMHSTFKDEVWLWRGQALKAYGVEPGMHTRVLNTQGVVHADATVHVATRQLLRTARSLRLDYEGSTRLPDLALLSHLQHYGAATPLLDVTADPLIALWMVAFANAKEPDSLDGESGLLFGIRKPPRERWITPLDARSFANKSGRSVIDSVGEDVWWYEAPDVTERLRIQRGSFLLGCLSRPKRRKETTLPIEMGNVKSNWVQKRMVKRGQPSNTTRASSDIFAIVVRGSTKSYLRSLLEERSGLSVEAVYPTPWNKPYIGQFAEGYGRLRDLSLDIPADVAEDLNADVELSDGVSPG